MDAPAYDERLKNACSESQYNSLIHAVAAQWDSRPCCLYHCCCPLCASFCCAFTFAICFPCVTIQKFAETSFNTKLIEVLEMETKEWKGSARLDVSLGSEAVNAAEEVGVDQNGACLGSGRTIRADAWEDDSHVWADMGTTWPERGPKTEKHTRFTRMHTHALPQQARCAQCTFTTQINVHTHMHTRGRAHAHGHGRTNMYPSVLVHLPMQACSTATAHSTAVTGSPPLPSGYNLVITVPGKGREFRDAWRQKPADPAAAALTKLTKRYTKMSPTAAARELAAMEPEIAATVLAAMKPAATAPILAATEPAAAAALLAAMKPAAAAPEAMVMH